MANTDIAVISEDGKYCVAADLCTTSNDSWSGTIMQRIQQVSDIIASKTDICSPSYTIDTTQLLGNKNGLYPASEKAYEDATSARDSNNAVRDTSRFTLTTLSDDYNGVLEWQPVDSSGWISVGEKHYSNFNVGSTYTTSWLNIEPKEEPLKNLKTNRKRISLSI